MCSCKNKPNATREVAMTRAMVGPQPPIVIPQPRQQPSEQSEPALSISNNNYYVVVFDR